MFGINSIDRPTRQPLARRIRTAWAALRGQSAPVAITTGQILEAISGDAISIDEAIVLHDRFTQRLRNRIATAFDHVENVSITSAKASSGGPRLAR